MKENLKHLSDLVDDDMVIEDSLGNIDTEFKYDGGFSDQEEVNEMHKMNAVVGAISSEISMIREVIRQQQVVSKYGIDIAKSGKQWEATPYWSSIDGDIMIEDLTDEHLSRIPRHLYNNGAVRNSDDLPPKIVDEIIKRGFELKRNCIVLRNVWQ